MNIAVDAAIKTAEITNDIIRGKRRDFRSSISLLGTRRYLTMHTMNHINKTNSAAGIANMTAISINPLNVSIISIILPPIIHIIHIIITYGEFFSKMIFVI